MCFYRQTLLSVCLILPWGVFAQPIAQDDLATTDEDTNVVFNIVSNDSGGAFAIDPATVDLDVSSPLTNENTFNAPEGVFSVSTLGVVTFDPADHFFGQAVLPYTVKNTNPSPETTGATITVTVTSVNDVPSITSIGSQNINEDGQTSVLSFTINDVETDPDDLEVTALSDNPSLVGNLNIDLAGAGVDRTIQVTPIANQSGVANITVTVDDGTDTNEITFAITVNPINDLPTITSIANQSISQDSQTGLLNFTVGDVETSVGSLSVTGTSDNLALVPNANIDVVGNTADRTVQVTPLAGQNGVATITLVVNDGTAVSQTTFQLTVNSTNTPPTITPIANQSIDEDTQTAFLDFTIGDAETPGTLQVTGASDNITLVPLANIELPGTGTDRTVRITPLANQSGIANITLTVDDGTATNAISFAVTVNPINDLPTISSIANQSISQDGQTGLLNFTVGDIETPVGSLSVTGTSNNLALVPNSNINVVGNTADRTVQVTPLAGQNGVATITLIVNDGTAASQTTFQLTVNSTNTPPTITPIANQSIDEDTQTAFLDFTVDNGENPGTLQVTGASDNIALVPVANIELAGAGSDRTVRITPLANQSGIVNITLTVDNGSSTAQTSFQVTVVAVNDVPTITAVANQNINEDAQTGALNFTVNDIETAAGSLSVTRTTDNPALIPLANVMLGGSGAIRNVTVTPLANLSGSATITLTVSDGVANTSTNFLVTVAAVNDVPTITAVANQNINEDSQTAALNFTINDIETAAGSLSVTRSTDNAALIPLANVVLGGSGAIRNVTVTPLANLSGSATITLTVSDGVANTSTNFLVTVAGVNDVPTITTVAAQNINEDNQTGALNFTIGDAETPSGSLTVTRNTNNAALIPLANVVLGGSGANRTVNVTPLADQSGTATITLTVSDGVANTSTNFQVNVSPVDDTPTISSIGNQSIQENTQTGPLPFNINDVETSATLLTLTRLSSNTALVTNANVVLGGSGSLRNVNVIPSINQIGMTTITLTVSDGANTALTAFQVLVTNVDDPPTITPIANQVIDEDASTAVLDFTVGDVDTGPGSVTPTGSSSNPALIPDGNIVFGGSDADRTVQVTPLPNQNGVATITITVSDGAETSFITFDVTVTAVNDVPVFTKGANQTHNEDAGAQSISSWATAINDGDPEVAQTLTFDVLNNNAGLFSVQPAVSPAGVLTFTPAPNANGVATVTVTLSDNGSGVLPNVNTSGPQNFTITITAVNDAPVFTKGANQILDENSGPQSVAGWATGIGDGDPELTQTLTFNVSNDNNALFATQPAISSAGTLSYTPTASAVGSTIVTVTLSDNGSGVAPNVNVSAAQTFTITISAVNSAPVFVKGANQTVNEDVAAQSVPNWATGIDDGDPEVSQILTFNVSNDNNALFSVQPTISSTGTLSYTPAANANGATLVTVTLSDNGSGAAPNVNTSGPQSFTITVTAINDAPAFTKGANQTVDENSAAQTVAGWATGISDGDPEVVQSLTFNVSNNNNALFSVQPAINSAGTLTYTPAATLNGSATVTVSLSDNGSGIAPNVNISAQQTFTITVNSINNAPSFVKGADQSVNEDAGLQTIPGWATSISDGDADLTQTLTFNVSNNNNALFASQPSISSAGVLTYTPAANANGVTTVTVTLSDDGSGAAPNVNTSGPQTFTITVNAVNDVPAFTKGGDQTFSENSGPQLVGGWATGITDGDPELSQTVSFNVSNNNNSLFSVQPTITSGGNLSFTPAASANGVATVTVSLSDNGSGVAPNVNTSGPQTFTITISPVNDAPSFTMGANQTVNEDPGPQTVAGWATAIDDGDAEVVQVLTFNLSNTNSALFSVQPAISPSTGNLTYTPAANANGSVTVTVTLVDNGSSISPNVNASAPETFTITINSVNDAPTISTITNQTITEDGQTGLLSTTVGDVETAAASLVLTATSSNTTLVPNANIILGGSGPSRTVNVIPVTDLSGVTTITVNVSDGTATTPMSFQVTVNAINDAPTITAIADQTIIEDTPTGALPFTIGDLDTPVGSLVITPSSSNATLVPIANIVIGGSGASRTVTVSPANNQTGVTTITLTVSDGTVTTATDFDVTVTPVNDPPTITTITDRTINEDSQTGTINFTIGDAETAASSLVVTGTSSNTTLVPNANIVLGGSGTSRTVIVIPAANQSGTTTITLSVNDGTTSVSTVFVVNVTAINDAPLITAQTPNPISISEVQPVVLALSHLTVVDPDDVYPTDFSLFVLGGANYSVVGTTVTPVPNFSGTLLVPVFVNDGSLSSPFFNVTIAVASTNDPPVITGQQTLTMNEDQTIALSLANLTVTDPDNVYPTDFTLTVLAGTNYTFTGTTVTPVANFNGTLVVKVKVRDGLADSPTFDLQITVNPVNDAPVITAQSPLSTNEDVAITLVIGNFTVTDQEPTTYTLAVSQVAGANYTVSGNTITPNLNFNGTLTVPVTVSDGFLSSASYNATITVVPVNDPPVITGQVSLSTIEDIPLALKLADLTVTDVDNTYPTGFSLTVLAGTNYTFLGNTITPVLDFVGTLTVNVRVNDGLANSATFPLQIQVTSEADVPKIIGQNPVTMSEDEVRTITIADLKVTDPDTPIGQITVTVLPGTNYTFTGNAIMPIAHFFGTLSVNVTVNDGESTSNTFALQVTVNSINDAPTFNSIPNVVLLEDAGQQTLTITGISPGPLETQLLLLNVTSNNTSLIPTLTQTPAYNGSAATAVISFRPEPNAFGVATITVEVTDPDFAKHTVQFTITVNSVNDAPTMNAITVAPIVEDAPEQIIPLSGISPGGGPAESGQALSIIPSSDKPEMFEVFEVVYTSAQPTGSLRIKPKPNANGTAQITLRLQDDGSNSPPNVNFVLRTFTLVTTAVNDQPAITSDPPHIAEPGQLYQYAIVVTDVEGEVITLTVPTKPAWLTVTPGANGQAMLSGTPPNGTTGNFDVLIEAKDPTGLPVQQPYTLTVNSRPVLSPVTIAVKEDESREFLVGDFTPGFADADGNSLSELEITKLPIRGTLKFGGNDVAEGLKIAAADLSSLTYTPKTDSTGQDTLRWNASDGFMSYSLTDTYAVLNVSTTNDAPVISVLETDTLKYELGSELPVFLTTAFDGYDPDDDNITSAEIGFKRIDDFKYRPENDRLIFPGSPKISGTFDEDAGILALSGTATAKEYVEAIRSIKYNYIDASDLLLDSRSVEFSLSDGQTVSLRKSRIITLVYTFSDLDIPTAFTPNGDKANEKWVISAPNGTEQYSDAELKVYNKRGLLVFKSTGLETPWDGIWNGEVLPSDVYFYTIELNYNKVKYKGTVTILR